MNGIRCLLQLMFVSTVVGTSYYVCLAPDEADNSIMKVWVGSTIERFFGNTFPAVRPTNGILIAGNEFGQRCDPPYNIIQWVPDTPNVITCGFTGGGRTFAYGCVIDGNTIAQERVNFGDGAVGVTHAEFVAAAPTAHCDAIFEAPVDANGDPSLPIDDSRLHWNVVTIQLEGENAVCDGTTEFSIITTTDTCTDNPYANNWAKVNCGPGNPNVTPGFLACEITFIQCPPVIEVDAPADCGPVFVDLVSSVSVDFGDGCGPGVILNQESTDFWVGQSTGQVHAWAGEVMATCEITVIVKDVTPPQLTVPADVSTTCGEPPAEVGDATASDTCGDVTITSTETKTSDGCVDTTVITYTATDGSSNAVTDTQTIVTATDSSPPSTGDADICLNPYSGGKGRRLLGKGGKERYLCYATLDDFAAEIGLSDNCDAGAPTLTDLTITESKNKKSKESKESKESSKNFELDGAGFCVKAKKEMTYVVSFVATDSCGNTGTQQATINVPKKDEDGCLEADTSKPGGKGRRLFGMPN